MAKMNIIGMSAKKRDRESYRTKINAYLIEFDKECDQSPEEKYHNWQSLVAFKSKKEAIKFVYEFDNLLSGFNCHPQYEACFIRIRKIKLGATSFKVSNRKRSTFFHKIP